ncbi:MAG TPA: rhomboid family intramembrane serine protease [Spirochaetales bacterium]|nr:rhomboid family intramembrane serine protease [Spirochaetales bacterium]
MNILRKEFRYSFDYITLYIIGANFIIYFLTMASPVLFYNLALVPQLTFSGSFWQPFTYMFVHAGFQHIFFNMLGLLIFGLAVERTMGSKEFLLFYLVTGTLAGIFSLVVFTVMNISAPLVGASGAIFAVLFAYAVIYPLSLIYIWGIIPVRAPVLVLGYTILEIFNEIMGLQGNVAHLTHLAGFAFSALYFPVRHGINPIKRLLIR